MFGVSGSGNGMGGNARVFFGDKVVGSVTSFGIQKEKREIEPVEIKSLGGSMTCDCLEIHEGFMNIFANENPKFDMVVTKLKPGAKKLRSKKKRHVKKWTKKNTVSKTMYKNVSVTGSEGFI